MADSVTPGSPEWWLKRLNDQLDARNRLFSKFDRYYRGDHDLQFASSKFRSEFSTMFLHACDNWMPLIVDSVQERLRVEGFRLGDSTKADQRVWRVWQANNLDADSDVLHTEALINGTAYTLVWPDADGQPRVTIEHPTQMIVAHAPDDRRRRLAAFKKWLDDDGRVCATLYLPDFVYKFRSRQKPSSGASRIRWEERAVDGEPWPLPNPFGRVPVTPLANQRRMLGDGESELGAGLTSGQDRINKLVFDMMLASEFGAFRQRWAIGMDIPKDENNQPVDTIKSAVNRLLVFNPRLNQRGDPANGAVSVGEFEATDLRNFVVAIDMEVQHLASLSKTPPHYLNASADRLSGESIKAAETGLVAKVKARQRSYGEGWEDTMRLALEVAGIRPRGGTAGMEVVWGDCESRSDSETVDSAVKKVAVGVPLRQIWSDMGYSQEQISRFAEMIIEEAALRRLMPTQPNAGGGDLGAMPQDQRPIGELPVTAST